MSGIYKVKVSEDEWQVWASTVNGEELLGSYETETEADARAKGKKKYMVGITTTFDGSVEIEAETADEAIEIAEQMLWEGKINTLAMDFEPDTQVHYAEEI